MTYWTEKVVLVTGGSRGLGRVLAETFAQRGAKVIVAARSQETLDETVRAIRTRGHQASAERADVLRDDDVTGLVARSAERYGRLDAVIHCVGRSARGAIIDTPPADFQQLWELNFLATVRLCRAAAPALLATHGHLVCIGSLAAKVASRYLGAYPASKFPLAAYCQQLRLELGPQGLHVLLVCPGPIAREDAGQRYTDQTAGLPDSARKPGGGARLRAIDPAWLAGRILRACEKHRPELVVPGRARLLFALTQLAPRAGDWLLRRMT